jgi:beta-1,4-mannosyltransferase
MLSRHGSYILIPHRPTENLYVSEFVAAYERLEWNVRSGPDQFWNDYSDLSIVHVHWPEDLYRWTSRKGADQAARETVERFGTLRALGVKIVWTVHNIAPHEHLDDPVDRSVYSALVQLADVIAHHCPYSVEALHKRYGKPAHATEVIVPHGHYFGYPQGIGRSEARKQLSLAEDEVVFLSFGIIRAYKGLDLILDAFCKTPVRKKRLLIAGRFQGVHGRKSLAEHWFLARLRYLTPRVSLHMGVVPTEGVQVFMEASDVVVLGHSRGLNSGLVPLGMTFGKVVVGPDIGCIGWTLRQGANLVYRSGDVHALSNAMASAVEQGAARAQETNVEIARSWDWDSAARTILEAIDAKHQTSKRRTFRDSPSL